MLSVLLLAQIASSAPAAQDGPSAPPRQLTLARVKAAEEPAAALELARDVLPADVANRLVEATVRRQWLPGQVWWIGAREAARPAGSDLCQREGHSVQAGNPSAPGDTAPSTTVLSFGPAESWTEVAVLPRGERPTAERCAGAEGYISTPYEAERSIASYRVLRAAMTAASASGDLPFVLTCRSEKPEACADARQALATLPMGALFGVTVSCLESEKIRRDNIISCPPLRAKQPYRAEASFGMSGNDGQSWRVAFVHRPGWPEEIALSRSMVIYH